MSLTVCRSSARALPMPNRLFVTSSSSTSSTSLNMARTCLRCVTGSGAVEADWSRQRSCSPGYASITELPLRTVLAHQHASKSTPCLPPGCRGLRDVLEGLAHPCLVTAAHRQIAQRHHPYEPLVAIKNWQAANLVPLHELDGVLDLLIVEAVGDVRGHRLADGCGVRIAPLRHCPYSDVTVRKHPDEPVAITDRKRSDIESSHLCGGLL